MSSDANKPFPRPLGAEPGVVFVCTEERGASADMLELCCLGYLKGYGFCMFLLIQPGLLASTRLLFCVMDLLPDEAI